MNDFEEEKKKKESKKESRGNLIAAIIAVIILGLIIWGLIAGGKAFANKLQEDAEFAKVMGAIAIILLAIGVGFAFYKYLSRGISKEKENVSKEKDNLEKLYSNLSEFFKRADEKQSKYESRTTLELENSLKEISTNFNKSINVDFSSEQKEIILEKLNDAITKNINEEFLEKINKTIGDVFRENKGENYKQIIDVFDKIKERLTKEIFKIRITAFRNLAIGSAITAIALFSLVYFVLSEHFDGETTNAALLHFIPRLSIAIFLELFAFFFLKLYRTNLDEIKYYHNEFTNAEMKFTSLIAATNFGKDADISGIVKSLGETERNFVLKKGESTVDLEKTKIDKDLLKEVLSSIAGSFKNGK